MTNGWAKAGSGVCGHPTGAPYSEVEPGSSRHVGTWFDAGATAGIISGTLAGSTMVWAGLVAVVFGACCAIALGQRWSTSWADTAARALFFGTGGVVVGCGLASGEWRRMLVALIGAAVVAGPWWISKVVLRQPLIRDGELLLIGCGGLVGGLFGVEVAAVVLAAVVAGSVLQQGWARLTSRRRQGIGMVVVWALLITVAGAAMVTGRDLMTVLDGDRWWLP